MTFAVPSDPFATLTMDSHAGPDVGSAASSAGSTQIPLPEVGGGGSGEGIVMDAVPLLPPALALMVAFPADIAVTSPVGRTVASVALELDQLNVTPVIVLPF
jgi:hypothetical protein